VHPCPSVAKDAFAGIFGVFIGGWLKQIARSA
jgi:hypothetical protein